MKRIVIELPNMRAYIKYDDPKVLGSVELELKNGDSIDVFNNFIMKHLKNHDAAIEKIEVLDDEKNVVSIFTKE